MTVLNHCMGKQSRTETLLMHVFHHATSTIVADVYGQWSGNVPCITSEWRHCPTETTHLSNGPCFCTVDTDCWYTQQLSKHTDTASHVLLSTQEC